MKLFYIALGGAIGSVLRYLIQGWVQRSTSDTFPTGTLAVNLLGCLVIGVLSAFFAGPHLIREHHRLGLTVGVIGGFTTFSTFALESFMLANDSQWRYALANMVASCVLGFLGVWLGYRLGEWWFGV
jgi:CrcB protein